MTTTHPPASRGRLLAVLGVGFGLAVTIGNSIGVGVLRTPGTIAVHLPEFWPFLTVWLLGAIYAFLGANAIAELGTMLPRSGGQYVFVRRGLGDYAGFVAGWSDWISTCGTTAAAAIVVGEYAVVLFPAARTAPVIALGVVLFFTLVQWFGIRAGSFAQNVTSLVKALALLFFIALCFWLGTRSPADGTAIVAEREGSLLLAFILSLQAVIYTFDGWTAVIYFSEEVKDSGKNIPRAVFGGVTLVTILYLLLNLAFLSVVSLPTIAGEKLSASIVAERLFGFGGDNFIRTLVVLLLLSAVNSNVMMAPRVIFAMARDRLFWRGAREVNQGGTPDVALMASSLLAALFVISGTFEMVVAKLAFFFVANYALSFITLFVLRRREPDTPRPWRAWGHPLTTGLALAASIVFLVAALLTDAGNAVYALVLLALSYPAYFLMKRRSS